jgi:hypothetical protein
VELDDRGAEGAAVRDGCLAVLRNLAEVHERIHYAMEKRVEEIKTSLGLPTEASWPIISRDAAGKPVVTFRNTFRGTTRPTDAEHEQKTGEAFVKFLHKGGRLTDIASLSPAFLASVAPGELVEFVVTRADEANVSADPNVSHAVLAGLDDAKAAGGYRIWTNSAGSIALCIVNRKSGHFRVPEEVLAPMTEKLVAAGVPRDRVLVVAGDFNDPSVVFALNLWEYKAQHAGEMSKEQGNAFFAEYKKLGDALRQEARELVRSLAASRP